MCRRPTLQPRSARLPRPKPASLNGFVGLRTALCDAHHCWPQQAVVKHITGLQDLNDGAARLIWPLGLEDRLVEIVIKTLALGIDSLYTVALEDPQELALGRGDAGEQTARTVVLGLRFG